MGDSGGDGELLYWLMVILRARESTVPTKPDWEARSDLLGNSKHYQSPTAFLIGSPILGKRT